MHRESATHPNSRSVLDKPKPRGVQESKEEVSWELSFLSLKLGSLSLNSSLRFLNLRVSEERNCNRGPASDARRPELLP